MFSIHNRRYLGSKFKLLPFIDEITSKHCVDCSSFVDLFGGTGVVANHFNNRFDIIVNDTLQSNVHSYKTFMSAGEIDLDKIQGLIDGYNQLSKNQLVENYYSQNFADTFLSHANMLKVGYIRDDIDCLYKQGELTSREFSALITSLLYAIDRIANTVGHYDAFRRTGELDKELIMELPKLNNNINNDGNAIYNCDANELVKQIEADIVYIDPPYNSRQYCDSYHFLENVATNQHPTVEGVARKMDRSHLKSGYCTAKAVRQFQDLIENINARYILVSYNNTENKINSRSNAKISDQQIKAILSAKGDIHIYEKDFNAFTTGKTNLNEHKERVFVCEVGVFKDCPTLNNKHHKDKIVKSPLNYTGGKAKLFPQIQAKLPDDIGVFYDVFCGGANVGINIKAEKIICIDKNEPLVALLSFLKNYDFLQLEKQLDELIEHYGLSQTCQHGYEYYNCNSSNGVGSYNKLPYQALKADYNRKRSPALFLLLIIFGFNNQIRFNNKGDFNMPVGKRDFNTSLRKKLSAFIERLKNQNIDFQCRDFRSIDIDELVAQQAFVYLDPPYLLGTASYNENGGWTQQDEMDLLGFLNRLHHAGVKFALSNVIRHKGETHTLLVDWVIEHAFNINHLSYGYGNANYQSKHKQSVTEEVLVTNF